MDIHPIYGWDTKTYGTGGSTSGIQDMSIVENIALILL